MNSAKSLGAGKIRVGEIVDIEDGGNNDNEQKIISLDDKAKDIINDFDNLHGETRNNPEILYPIAARQVFGALKKAEVGSIPEPDFAFEAVPEDINTYSDGGYLNPSNHDFGIATAAAWKPHPEGLTRDATPVEKAHGECREKDDGIENMIMLQDPIGSSTRSELRGLIAAVAGPCTAHVGIDSQACMNRAQNFIAIAQKA